ncbi:hypothetical protein MASSI9I_50819 [Massilia sp. 9I]|nr:hypothetical protein MASSI9I_50819 [Massilia sp. 9I]
MVRPVARVRPRAADQPKPSWPCRANPSGGVDLAVSPPFASQETIHHAIGEPIHVQQPCQSLVLRGLSLEPRARPADRPKPIHVRIARRGSASSHISAMLAMRNGPDPSAPAPPPPHATVPVIVFHGDADAAVHRTNSSGVVRQSLDSQALHRRAADTGIAAVAETGLASGRELPAMCTAILQAACWPGNGPCTGPAMPGRAATCAPVMPTPTVPTPAQRCGAFSSAARLPERQLVCGAPLPRKWA